MPSVYEASFGLTDAPFGVLPDERFYFDSSVHRQALAHLRVAALEGEGCMLLVGEPGVGKSLVVRVLLDQLAAEPLVVLVIPAAQLVAEHVEATLRRALRMALGRVEATPPGTLSGTSLFDELGFLQRTGRRAWLVIDEAQHLDASTLLRLERLRASCKGAGLPLHTLLVGMPELRERLQQLAAEEHTEPVALCCQIGPLGETETRGYIEHRLRRAGWSGRPHLDERAQAALYLHSRGVPRRINRLCDRVLLHAQLDQLDAVSQAQVESAARDDINGDDPGSAPQPASAPRPREASIPVLMEAISEPIAPGGRADPPLVESNEEAAPDAAPATLAPEPAARLSHSMTPSRARFGWVQAGIVAGLMLLVAGILGLSLRSSQEAQAISLADPHAVPRHAPSSMPPSDPPLAPDGQRSDEAVVAAPAAAARPSPDHAKEESDPAPAAAQGTAAPACSATVAALGLCAPESPSSTLNGDGGNGR